MAGEARLGGVVLRQVGRESEPTEEQGGEHVEFHTSRSELVGDGLFCELKLFWEFGRPVMGFLDDVQALGVGACLSDKVSEVREAAIRAPKRSISIDPHSRPRIRDANP